MRIYTKPSTSRGEGYSWEFLVGVCRPVLQILTRFQTKKCNFPHPFSDQTSKIHTRFQTWPLGRNYVIITQIRAQTKNYSNPFRIRIFLFLSYSFGIETINKFIHPVVPSKTIPDSRPRQAKCIPVFRPKWCKTPTLWGGTQWNTPPPREVRWLSAKIDIGFKNIEIRVHAALSIT